MKKKYGLRGVALVDALESRTKGWYKDKDKAKLLQVYMESSNALASNRARWTVLMYQNLCDIPQGFETTK